VNFNTVSDEMLDALVKFQFRYLSFAIDGARQETYSKYRAGGDFKQVISNIKRLIHYKKQYNSEFPSLSWQYVLMEHNESDIINAKKIASELGIPIQFKLSWDAGTAFKNREFVKKETGLKFLSREEREAATKTIYSYTTCEQLFLSPQINWDGRLLGCCCVYQDDFGVNVFEIGLQNALQSPNYVLAKKMITGILPCPPNPVNIPCAICGIYKKMIGRNLFINEPLVLDTQDVETLKKVFVDTLHNLRAENRRKASPLVSGQTAFPNAVQKFILSWCKPLIRLLAPLEYIIKFEQAPSDYFFDTKNLGCRLILAFLSCLGPKPEKTGFSMQEVRNFLGK